MTKDTQENNARTKFIETWEKQLIEKKKIVNNILDLNLIMQGV